MSPAVRAAESVCASTLVHAKELGVLGLYADAQFATEITRKVAAARVGRMERGEDIGGVEGWFVMNDFEADVFSFADFLMSNPDDGDSIAIVSNLAIGETARLGGGAFATQTITRIR